MRKLRVSILLTIIALLMLLPMIKPTQKVKASFQEYTISVYAIPCRCPIGPGSNGCPGTLVGYWTYNCFSYSGWGVPQGEAEPCERDEISYGNECVFE